MTYSLYASQCRGMRPSAPLAQQLTLKEQTTLFARRARPHPRCSRQSYTRMSLIYALRHGHRVDQTCEALRSPWHLG